VRVGAYISAFLERSGELRIRIGAVSRIQLYAHVTWIIAIALVYTTMYYIFRGTPLHAWLAILSTIIVFASILAHELAHVAVASRRGLATHSVTMSFLGGLARIDGIPRTPSDEAAIAIAGPALSILVGSAFLLAAYGAIAASASAEASRFLIVVAAINLAIGLYNLIPIHPTDGGRLLHALLWKLRNNRHEATQISALLTFVMASALIGTAASVYLIFHRPNAIVYVIVGFILLVTAKTHYVNAKNSNADLRAGERERDPARPG
jgi:Zn-dependent protease